MRYAVLAICLFSASSVMSTVSWVVSTPELASDYDPYATAPSREVASNNSTFSEWMKASLKENASEPPGEVLMRPIKASYDNTYGVNKEFMKRACHEFTKRTP
jgi:hypothetical protein